MDTSDDECFESADEDFHPDGEDDSKSVRRCVVSQVEKDLRNLKLLDSSGESKGEKDDKISENISKVDQDSVIINKVSATEIIESPVQENVDVLGKNDNTSIDSQQNCDLDENEDTSSSDITHSQPSQLKKNTTLDKEPEIDETGICTITKVEDNIEPNEIEQTKVGNITPDPQIQVESSDNEENMWENDDWEPFEKIEPDKSYPKEPETSWSEWGTWGVTSILTTATQGVSTLTNQVSQGLSTVLETGIGIPDPKELARQDRVLEDKEIDDSSANSGFGFGNLSNLVSGVSHITKFVENTGSKVITGGLDTLETIGKKTMEVLQEGDPGLKNKRALLKLDKEKPILSQVLREAKEKSERENRELQEKHSKKKLNYETLFDDYHGLVHLEALEMLSKQCDIKLQTLLENSSGNELTDLQETMDQIKELCELPDEDDDETPTFEDIKEKIETAVKEINVNITYNRLISAWEETEIQLNNLKLDVCKETEIHQEALQILAQITAIAVEQFHKCGELLLIKERRSTVDEADSLVQLTTAVTSLIGLVAAKFSDKLNMKYSQTGNKDSINELITNVFFEAGNSSSYVQDAFQLLVPVLQVGAV